MGVCSAKDKKGGVGKQGEKKMSNTNSKQISQNEILVDKSGNLITNNADSIKNAKSRVNNQRQYSFLYLPNFEFYQNIKEEDGIKLVSMKQGFNDYNNFYEWEELLKDAERRVQSNQNYQNILYFTKGISEESTSVSEDKLCKRSNIRGNSIMNNLTQNVNNNQCVTSQNNTQCSQNLKNKFTVLLDVLYNEDKNKLCSYLEKGPPNNLRWLIWMTIVKNHYYKEDLSQYYTSHTPLRNVYQSPITGINKNLSVANSRSNERLYNYFLTKTLSEDLEEQINKDLHRTAPFIKYFNGDQGMKSLYNILKTLALYDVELAYCQGINILVAYILLVSDGNEVETFYLMRYMFSKNFGLKLKDFYTRGFPKLHQYIFISKKLIETHLNSIHLKLEEIIPPGHDEIWLFKWIQSLYTHILDFSIAIRLWDCIIVNGLDFIFPYTLAILKFFEKDIFQADDIGDFIYLYKNNPVISNKNNPSKLEEVIQYRDKIINFAIEFKNKIKEEDIEKIKEEYENDPVNNVNQYMDYDSCFSNNSGDIAKEKVAGEINPGVIKSKSRFKDEYVDNNIHMSILTLQGRRISTLSSHNLEIIEENRESFPYPVYNENPPVNSNIILTTLSNKKMTYRTLDTNFSQYFSSINDEQPNKDKPKKRYVIKNAKKKK